MPLTDDTPESLTTLEEKVKVL